MKNLLNSFRSRRELKQFIREKAAQGESLREPLCIMDDLVFKAMFTSNTEDSRAALRSLLSACTRREVTDITVLNNELQPAHLKAKAVRLDVNVRFSDGELANLEMQMHKTGDDLRKRAGYYAAMLLAGQSNRGEPYSKIKRVYQIFFLNYILFPQSEKLSRRYRYMEIDEHDHLPEGSEIIFYELPKLEQRVKDYFSGKEKTETKYLSEEEKWCIFLKYRHEKRAEPLITELCSKEEGIMRAQKEAEKVSRSFLKYLRDMDRIKNEYEREVMREAAREEGLAQGHAEGHAEGHAQGHIEGHVEGQQKIIELLKSGKSPEEIIREFGG